MDTLCATFEEWYIGDGTYPPLHKGQKVNLAFYINPTTRTITDDGTLLFEQIRYSEYRFCGKVIRTYSGADSQIIIVDTGDFRFYLEEFDTAFQPATGQFIAGQGTLLPDYYIWAENLGKYPDLPNLFYNFRIERIFKIAIPERFIYRHANGLSAPTSLPSGEYSDNDVQEIEDMKTDHSSTEFYLLDLKFIDEEIARTIILL